MPNNNISSALDAKVIDIMTRKVSEIANAAKSKVTSDPHLPNNIADATSVTKVDKTGNNTYRISIIVDVDKAPAAAAFEYGSGERATRGVARAYPIPTTPGKVAFLWKYPSPLGRKKNPFDEWVVFSQISHPGVAPNPYLKPAVDAGLEDFRTALAKSFKEAYLSVTDKVTKIRAT